MPVLEDIMDHDVFGPMIKKARLEGELRLLRLQLEKRCGSLPRKLERMSVRIFDAKTLGDLLKP